MYLKLESIREECGGCPTHYSGKTVHGNTIEMYLRHGGLWIKVDGQRIVNENASPLDGICSIDDFKVYARKNGHFIDTDDAKWSSHVQEEAEKIEKLFANKVWVTFVQDFYSKSTDKTYKKGKKYIASLDTAQALIDSGLVIIEESYDIDK